MTKPTTAPTSSPSSTSVGTSGISGLEHEAPGLVSNQQPRNGSGRPRRRTLIAVAVALLLVLVTIVALTTGSSAGGALDPRSAAPGGTRALATLLRNQGVKVERGSTAGRGHTVLVPFPEALTESDLSDLLSSGADVVLIDPGDVSQAQVTATYGLSVRTRPAGCRLPAATVAGDARLGGARYESANAATSCYGGALLDLPAGTVPGGGRLTILGSSDFLTNARLDQQGNAALSIGLLSRQPALTWYSERRATSGTSLGDLLPESIPWAILQVVIAIGLIGVWRGRRLGPIVTEPLPVVVRAAETVLGRARLYAAARARGTAAEALRGGSRARLATLTHLQVGQVGTVGQVNTVGGQSTPEALISAVSLRTGTDPAAIAALLYEGGGPPGYGAAESDDALVRLANELDRLEDLVREGTRR